MNAILSGRCTDGFEFDRGRRVHSADRDWGVALCGAKPGRTSAYGFMATNKPIDCPRCLERSSVLEAQPR